MQNFFEADAICKQKEIIAKSNSSLKIVPVHEDVDGKTFMIFSLFNLYVTIFHLNKLLTFLEYDEEFKNYILVDHAYASEIYEEYELIENYFN